jgi:pyrroloquinoline quinone biosynthesis protein B
VSPARIALAAALAVLTAAAGGVPERTGGAESPSGPRTLDAGGAPQQGPLGPPSPGGAGSAIQQGPPGTPSSGAVGSVQQGPLLVALGTVQDGGLPQAGCECARCVAARRDPALRRRVASVGIWSPASGRFYLVDATPDLGAQIEEVHRVRGLTADLAAKGWTDRKPVDGVLLTHAHIGHYLGLAFFGFEALNTQALPVYGSARMTAFLAANAPWDRLVRRGNIVTHVLAPGEPLALGDGLTAVALAVPHRAEYTDTLAFVVRGPHVRVLYVPDTDSWAAWPVPLLTIVEREKVDIALLDGTFESAAELPGRDVRQIGHPLMTETMDLLAGPVAAGRLQVYFTHLNHSNRALDPGSAARRGLEARGFRVLAEGQQIGL